MQNQNKRKNFGKTENKKIAKIMENSWILKRIPELQNYRIPQQRLKNSSNENGFNRVDCWLSDISRVFWLQKVKHETRENKKKHGKHKEGKTIDFEEFQNYKIITEKLVKRQYFTNFFRFPKNLTGNWPKNCEYDCIILTMI